MDYNINYFHRPDYARLSQLTTVFQNLPIMALTATAPPRVRDQILNEEVWRHTFEQLSSEDHFIRGMAG